MILAILFLLTASVACAGTVSLTGTCNYATSSSLVNFTLSNSGNEAAANIVVTAEISGALIKNDSYHINSLGSAAQKRMSFDLAPIGVGGYVGYFNVSYIQGSEAEYSVFPCMFYFGKTAYSKLSMNESVDGIGSNAMINVTVRNPTNENIPIVLEIILPKNIVVPLKEYAGIIVDASSRKNFSFVAQEIPQGASDTGFLMLSYYNQSTHFASISGFNINGNMDNTVKYRLSPMYPFYLFSSFAIILAILILRIAVRDYSN